MSAKRISFGDISPVRVLHVCKFEAKRASRVVIEQAWDSGLIMDTSSNNDYKLSYRSLFLLIKSGTFDSIVFHMQSSLPFLLWSYLIRKVTRSNMQIIYDIHDLNYRPNRLVSYMGFRFLVLSFMETIAFIIGDKLITVSKGLSRIFYSKYGKWPDVVYNVPETRKLEFEQSHSLRSGLVYFGLINRLRLPEYLLDALEIANIRLDLYGEIDDKDEEFIMRLRTMEVEGYISLKDRFQPGDLSFLNQYKWSLLVFGDGGMNIKYCLPNKLFQSASFGLGCLISDNLIESISLFDQYREFVCVMPGDTKKLAEELKRIEKIEVPDNTQVLDYLKKLHIDSRATYTRLVNS